MATGPSDKETAVDDKTSQKAIELHEKMHHRVEAVGNLLVEAFHYLALFVIGAITVYAGTLTAIDILAQDKITIDDILLLFIYLELGAMVGIYFKTNHMPVRFLIYVAITALTRLMISDISHHNDPNMGVVYISAAILLLALAVLVVRFGSARYPSIRNNSKARRFNDEKHEGLGDERD
ncbi:MAG: phosphate-starvation-inducible protein PsiE [Alcaligenaceae bacterium]|jgi:phosphate starvation-inducible membrane PsiE|nr:phosphate-starvation-inducible protein PsiE [Alcaligenaceae bacterium]